jgi:hypothetical protein
MDEQNKQSAVDAANSGSDEAELTDADLIEQFNQLSPFAQRHGFHAYRRLQHERNQARQRRAAMTPTQRRRDDLRQLADSGLLDTERHYIHSVLALCAMPYRRPPDDQRDYVREFGRSSLVLQAGYLRDPHSGKMVKQGLPYGPKPRLLMVHLCSQAMRTNSAEIAIDDSLSAFIRALGFDVTGGERGTIAAFKEQLHRLAATHMQIGLWTGEQSRTINTQPFESIDLWMPDHPDQRMLWPTTVRFDPRFFASLQRHALPVDVRVLKAFSQSARQMDLVMWLGYRLPSLKEPLKIGWAKLQEQFGKMGGDPYKFRQTFSQDCAAVTEVFGRLPVQLDDTGLLLRPADPRDLLLPAKRTRLR